jgi:hypothetical protein
VLKDDTILEEHILEMLKALTSTTTLLATMAIKYITFKPGLVEAILQNTGSTVSYCALFFVRVLSRLLRIKCLPIANTPCYRC